MTARRIIPCLDVKDGRVVKGVKFVGHTDMGDAAELAARYRDAGADELVFYDITASPEGRTLDYGWVRDIARLLDIPFSVAGGIRTVDQAARCLDHGADKVSINSPALERPELIAEMAARLGGQCVVVGVDSRLEDGEWVVHKYTGDPDAPGLGRIARLEQTIAERAAADPSESWTAKLMTQGVKRIAQKVGEEGVETALAGVAGPDEELASEAADLIYHLLVLLHARNMVFQDVLDVLASRAEAGKAPG